RQKGGKGSLPLPHHLLLISYLHVVDIDIISRSIRVQVELEGIIEEIALSGVRRRVNVALCWRMNCAVNGDGIMKNLVPAGMEIHHNVMPGVAGEWRVGNA